MPPVLLLADDSVTIQRVIALTFADQNIDVVTVSDGDQAIQHIEHSPPDIVLADLYMPNKNGYEVARHIKQSPRLANIPVVLLTSALEPVDQNRANEVGCDAVLVKPFEPQQVITRVKDLLGRATRKGELDEYFDRLDQELTSLVLASKDAPPRNGDGPSDGFSSNGSEPKVAMTPGPEAQAALVDTVTERVLARLSDARMVRERVEDIVLRVAERLVREEIERIKSSIK